MMLGWGIGYVPGSLKPRLGKLPTPYCNALCIRGSWGTVFVQVLTPLFTDVTCLPKT